MKIGVCCGINALLFIFAFSVAASNGDSASSGPKKECIQEDLTYEKNPADSTILFVGALLPEKTQSYYINLQRQIAEKGINMQNTLPNKMHVTIRFLGGMNNKDMPEKKKQLGELLTNIEIPETITMKPIGFKVGGMILAKVLSPELQRLFDQIGNKLTQGSCKGGRGNFMAHVTLGTFSKDQRKPSRHDLEQALKDLGTDDVVLTLERVHVLGLPADKVGAQYTDKSDYEIILTLQK